MAAVLGNHLLYLVLETALYKFNIVVDVVCCWCFSKEPELSRELQLMLRCDGNKLETVPLSARRRNRMHDSNMEIGKI